MSTQLYSVVLRIRHPDLDPMQISRELGILADHCWRAGDIRPGTSAVSGESRYAETYWVARLRTLPRFSMPETVEGTLSVAALLLKTRKSFWETIRSGGGRVDLLVSLAAGDSASVDLAPETLAQLSGIGLSISFETDGLEAAVA